MKEPTGEGSAKSNLPIHLGTTRENLEYLHLEMESYGSARTDGLCNDGRTHVQSGHSGCVFVSAYEGSELCILCKMAYDDGNPFRAKEDPQWRR